MLTEEQRRFLEAQRVARLATVDPAGQPHVVPICYALIGGKVCFTIDRKPKRAPDRKLGRLVNLEANPVAAVVVDRYDEDWRRLGWVMLRGPAEILASGPVHDRAQARLRARYPQLGTMDIAGLPVILITIARVTSWGALDVA